MKSSITKNTFKAIYRLLDRVSPIDSDCGRLCGAICCTCGDDTEEDMGMYLLPGEEKLFTRHESWLTWEKDLAGNYEFPKSWTGWVYFLNCRTAPSCPREKRPLQCRIFPLTPHLDEDGTLYMIYQKGELPYSCPLITERIPLNDSFLKANYTVWKHLIRDPLIYDLVEMDSCYRIEDGEDIEILYP